MARNRKCQPAAIRFGPALKALLLCAIFCGSGVGYVWQKSQIDELARQIRQREKRLSELMYLNQKSRDQLATFRSVGWITERAKKLGMGLPLESQKWRLVEPAETVPVAKPEGTQLYAAQSAVGRRTP